MMDVQTDAVLRDNESLEVRHLLASVAHLTAAEPAQSGQSPLAWASPEAQSLSSPAPASMRRPLFRSPLNGQTFVSSTSGWNTTSVTRLPAVEDRIDGHPILLVPTPPTTDWYLLVIDGIDSAYPPANMEVPPPDPDLDCVRYVVREPQIEEFHGVVIAFNRLFVAGGEETEPYHRFGGIERAQVDLLPSNTLRRAAKGVLRALPLRTLGIFTPDGASHNFVQFLRGGNIYMDVLKLGLGMPPTTESESEDGGEGGGEVTGAKGDPVREDAEVRGSVEQGEDAGSEDVENEDAGSVDVGSVGAGSEDAGSKVAGSEGAGSEDAGSEDAGSEDSEAGSEGEESEDDYLEDLHRVPVVSLSETRGFFAALGEYTLLQTVFIWTNARLFHDMGLQPVRPLCLVKQFGEYVPTLLNVYFAYTHSHATNFGRWNSRQRDHYRRASGTEDWSRKAWADDETVEGAICISKLRPEDNWSDSSAAVAYFAQGSVFLGFLRAIPTVAPHLTHLQLSLDYPPSHPHLDAFPPLSEALGKIVSLQELLVAIGEHEYQVTEQTRPMFLNVLELPALVFYSCTSLEHYSGTNACFKLHHTKFGRGHSDVPFTELVTWRRLARIGFQEKFWGEEREDQSIQRQETVGQLSPMNERRRRARLPKGRGEKEKCSLRRGGCSGRGERLEDNRIRSNEAPIASRIELNERRQRPMISAVGLGRRLEERNEPADGERERRTRTWHRPMRCEEPKKSPAPLPTLLDCVGQCERGPDGIAPATVTYEGVAAGALDTREAYKRGSKDVPSQLGDPDGRSSLANRLLETRSDSARTDIPGAPYDWRREGGLSLVQGWDYSFSPEALDLCLLEEVAFYTITGVTRPLVRASALRYSIVFAWVIATGAVIAAGTGRIAAFLGDYGWRQMR
ncbi:hypothetical protein DFP72DRAFT_853747 [Ephemerocybe angulata]|uniref:Uncharacterized protein n=1 Tax=Ephemerocybe angulata TaxID=980116 RepID=A0A8H6HKA4_9AGAR|nr:hypothetical protein DFP72DRAFT_853747 [Tulosesus angulatus]